MQPKKYTLLKRLPMCNAGTEFVQEYTGMYKSTSNTDHPLVFPQDTVEDSPEWFKEVKPQRIVVNDFTKTAWNHVTKESSYRLITDNIIPEERLPYLKEAIENVLNDNGETYLLNNVVIQYDGIKVYVGGEEYVSKKAVDKIREDTWAMARRRDGRGSYLFSTIDDYLKAIRK